MGHRASLGLALVPSIKLTYVFSHCLYQQLMTVQCSESDIKLYESFRQYQINAKEKNKFKEFPACKTMCRISIHGKNVHTDL